MYAIIKTGGKQYKVAADDVIEVEKLAVEPGGVVELDVVFIADGSTITADGEELLKAKVFATVLEQFKGDKQIIFKFKKRKGYKRLKGHRQNLTRLKIDAISLDGKAPKVTKGKAKKDEDSSAAKPKAKKAEVADDAAADNKAADEVTADEAVENKTEDTAKDAAEE